MTMVEEERSSPAPDPVPDPAPAPRTFVRTQPVDTTPRTKGTGSESRRIVSTLAFVTAGVLAWVFVYLFVLSSFQQGHSQSALYNQLRSELAEGIAPYAAPIPAGHPVALMDSEALGLDHLVVVEGTTSTLLQQGPGHLLGSVMPGQAGTSVLLGRSVSFGAPFRYAGTLRAGDDVTVTTMQGEFRYVVTGVRREGDPVPAPLEDGQSRLILMTSGNDGQLPGLRAGETLYVDATLDGEAQPATAVSALDPAGQAFESDRGASTLALLALALEVLVGGVVLVQWARHRWSPLAAWVTGMPVVLAALWLTSSVAARLLPNLI